MQTQTHILSGWIAANLLPSMTARQRLMSMIAAAIPDLDGLSYLGGQEAFWNWHHRACHNLPFGILACGVMTLLSGGKIWLFFWYLALFHLHLVMDIFGSGPCWGIYYFWPFSGWMFDNSPYSWDFYSWENLSIAAGLIAWTILIAVRAGRTPLEAIMPRLDGQTVRWLRSRFRFQSA
jgi:inner membrane protein